MVDKENESSHPTLSQPAQLTAPQLPQPQLEQLPPVHARHTAVESYATHLAMTKASPNEAKDL